MKKKIKKKKKKEKKKEKKKKNKKFNKKSVPKSTGVSGGRGGGSDLKVAKTRFFNPDASDQDQRCRSGPSAKDSVIFSGGNHSKNYGAGSSV